MGGNRTGCAGCVTIFVLLIAGGLMIEAWDSVGSGGDVAMVLIVVALLVGGWFLGHKVVTSEAFRVKQGHAPRVPAQAVATAPGLHVHNWGGPRPNGDHWEQRCGCGKVRFTAGPVQTAPSREPVATVTAQATVPHIHDWTTPYPSGDRILRRCTTCNTVEQAGGSSATPSGWVVRDPDDGFHEPVDGQP